MNSSGAYQSLIEKLDRFIRKYYTNQLIRGAIFSAIYVIAFFLAINLLEYYFYLSPLLRKVLFFGFIVSSAAFIAKFVAEPLLRYYRLGKVISYEQAAGIIGTHFAEVKDKLLNILQLHHASAQQESQLLLAAIDQKAVELKPVDFSFAIDLGKNKKYLRYLAPPALLFLFIVIAAPNILKEGTKRLYHNDTFYEKEAPFRFVIQNKNLKAMQFENFVLELKIEGDALPAEVQLLDVVSGNTFNMKKKDASGFSYEFVNLQKTTLFRFTANGFRSKEYKLDVVAKPVVASFDISCNYPAYTGKQDELLKNIGDIVVPAGTKLTWHFNTANVDDMKFVMDDSVYTIKRSDENTFTFSKTLLQSTAYKLSVSNANAEQSDFSYSINVIPDLYPVIAVQERNDSATQKYFYYIGEVSDDYGLRNLTFNYQITRADSTSPSALKLVDVNIAKGNASRFTYYWSLSDLGVKPGDRITYYFEVWDNDGVHGSKSTRSNLMEFNMPTLNQLNKEIAQENKEIKQELKDMMKDAKDLKKDLQNMKDKLQEKQNANWEDKKNLQENIEKQKDLMKQMEEMKAKMEQNFEKQSEFKQVDEKIAEKQERLKELMDKTLSDEMKKLMEKLEKMLDQLQKKDAMEKMDDMKSENEKVEKELDRMLELFKKLEFEQKLQETTDKLQKLAEKQEELAKRAQENKDAKNEALQKELEQQQEKLNQELKEAQKDVQDLKKMNEETKSEQDFKEIEESLENAEKQQQDAQQDMEQKKNESASKNQKSAANNMKNAAQKMSDMKMQMEQEQNAEDMQAIRQLLENIVQLSFDEEKLMNNVKATNINNPKYVELMKEQQRIRENSKMVEDSLYALAKRQDQIKSFITKEITSVNKYLGKSIDDMEDRNVVRAMSQQQFVMTGYNNLALMLSEALQQMQQQQSESQQKSSGSPKNCMKCKKPGAGLPNLSKMQKQLNDKIQKMGEMMKREGQGQKPGQQGMSREFAEMAQMQQQIRKELEKINQQENKDGKGSLGNLGEAIKKMEDTEKNLVNKQLTTEMQKRQNEILNKLLEAENAQRQRDEQPERESNTGKDTERTIPPSLEEYLKARQSETDFYKTVPPSLKPYYKNLADKYFRNITIGQP